MLQKMTRLYESIAVRGNSPDVPYIEIGQSNLLSTWGKQLQVCATEGELLQNSPSEGVADNPRNQMLRSLEYLHILLKTIAKTKGVGEDPTVIKTKAIEALVARFHPDNLPGTEMKFESGSVYFPKSFTERLKGAGDLVDVQVISSLVNYYYWDSSANLVTSPVLGVNLRDESGEIIPVSNLTNDLQLAIQLNDDDSFHNESVVESSFLKPGKMRYHRINVTQERTAFLITLTVNTHLNVFVKRGRNLSEQDCQRTYTIPDLTSCDKYMDEEEYNCSRNPHQLLLTPDVLTETGIYYLGLLYKSNVSWSNHSHRTRRSCFNTNRQKRSCVETKDPPPSLGEYVTSPLHVFDPLLDVNYTIEIEELSCLFWSRDKQKWVTEGCKVGPGSSRDRLLCLCNHLTSFGGGLLVSPNPIDINVVFMELSRLHETGNFGVSMTIIFVLAFYLLAVVLAKRSDRRDLEKVGPKVFLDTEEDEELLSSRYQYEIIVSTGVWQDCGTTAVVTMVFFGSSGSSGRITVSPEMNPSKILLSRGGVDTFVIYLSEPLGTVHHAYIWHDNSGDSPSWFLDYVVIKDKQNNKKWKMGCNQWFSPDKDDGNVFRKLSVENENSRHRDFKEAFRSRISGSLYETHLWMSSVTKRPGDFFTRTQRVTCCLCIVFTAMLANAMFYNLDGEVKSNSIRLGPLKVSIRQIVITLQSCLVIAPINFLIVAIFKNSRSTFDKHCCKYWKCEKSQDQEEEDEESKPLHHIFVYIAWLLCFAVVVSSAAVVFFYSLIWGKETADEWLCSILMSITMDILAIQPVRLIVLSALAAIITTKARKTKAKFGQSCRSVQWNDEKFDGTPEIDIGPLPDPRQLEWFKKYRIHEAKTMSVFRSVTFFIAFLVVLAVVCYGNRDSHQYLMVQETRGILSNVTQVRDALGLWHWLIDIFATGVYAGDWYNGNEEANKVYINDKASILVGMPRIRQLRIRQDVCPKTMVEGYNVTGICYPHYSFDYEDQTPMYLPKWKPPPTGAPHAFFEKLCPKPWQYQSSEEMGNLISVSPRASYGGGGYVADLGYDLQTARGVVDDLSENNWIDRRTRAIIVEFSVFNVHLNLLVAANYFFEFLPTGGVFSYTKVEPLQLYGTETGHVQLVLLFRLVLIVMVVAYLVVEVVKLCRQSWSYFTNLWNWISAILVITSITAVVIHIVGESTTTNVIQDLRKNIFATVSFHRAALLLNMETIILSVVIFLATVKLLSLMRFNKQIIILSITIRLAGKSLASFSIIFLVIFFSFALSGMLMFGYAIESYSSFRQVCVSQMEFLLGKIVPKIEMSKIDPFLAYFFSTLYIWSMTILFLNVFISILASAMEEFKQNQDCASDELDLADFIVAYFTQGLLNMLPRRNPRNKRKLYCVNITFEDECSYMEDSLGEIDRRVSILAKYEFDEDHFLMKDLLFLTHQ